MFKKILMSLFISNLLLAEDINIKIEEGEEFKDYNVYKIPDFGAPFTYFNFNNINIYYYYY